MNRITITKNDYLRIQKSIDYAKMKHSIGTNEAENLLNELHSALIVDPHEVAGDVVTMNSIIKISFLDTNKSMQVQIVYPGAADIKMNKISILSPVATALIGNKVSDEIEWIVPSGLTKIRIEEIIYQPEAEGHFHL
jgi:regulator of nucleoside diphosphate kinase